MTHESDWDEQWACPVHETGIAAGSGKAGGSCVVTFTEPPKCWCGREMEQRTDFPIQPEEIG